MLIGLMGLFATFVTKRMKTITAMVIRFIVSIYLPSLLHCFFYMSFDVFAIYFEIPSPSPFCKSNWYNTLNCLLHSGNSVLITHMHDVSIVAYNNTYNLYYRHCMANTYLGLNNSTTYYLYIIHKLNMYIYMK